MSDWRSISRDDLLSWAGTELAAQRLPQLVRRLVFETGEGVEVVDVAEGRGVLSRGLDGFVRAARGTTFVPAGVSVWELSVEHDYKKADRDYGKRVELPDGSPTADAIYNEVIVRPWLDRSEWASNKTAQGRWREVRAYGVDAVATWLEQAPGTRVWFAEQLGLPVTGLWSATEWWTRWSTATDPDLTPEHVLARPDAAVEVLQAELARPGVATVGGPLGGDEMLAVTVAAALTAGEQLVAPLLVVKNRDAWQRLLEEPNALVLVTTDPGFAQDVDPSTRHSVVIAVDNSPTADVMIEPIDASKLASLLREGETAPFELAVLAHRSLVAFRRRLAKKRELMRPEWAASRPPQAVRGALLLTSWNDRNAADRVVVEALSGMPYSTVRDTLLPYAQGDDPCLALAGDRWHIVSPVDAMTQLAQWVIRDDLDGFVDVATRVLSEVDPRLELPAGERWRASLDDRHLDHSAQIRQGIATSLAVLGAFGDLLVAATGRSGEEWAGTIVYRVLREANRDRTGRRWASVSGSLPLMAEAAPRVFLEAVREGLAGTSPVLATVFQDREDEGALQSSSPHTGLLWALENLAWSPQYFAESIRLLAMLAAIDPGGRLSNRPQASLEHIMCSWHPDTAVDARGRLDAIDLVLSRWPDIGWRLMLSLLPDRMGSTHFPTHEPRYRDWKPAREPVLVADFWHFIGDVIDRMLNIADAHVGRWRELLESHNDLTPELRTRVRFGFAAVDWDSLTAEDRAVLWDSGRELVNKHREYADAQWALPQAELDEIDGTLARLAPEDPATAHRWLFRSGWVNLGDLKRRDDHRAYDEELARRRAEAVREISDLGGLSAVLAFSESLDHPNFVGIALADATDGDLVDQMLPRMDDPAEETRETANAYLWRLCRTRGLEWVSALIDERDGLTPRQVGLLINFADDFDRGTALAHELGADVESEYWRTFSYLGLGDFPHVVSVAYNLIGVGRLAAALDLLSLYLRDEEVGTDYAEAVAAALEAVMTADEPVSLEGLRQWGFERLFACLDLHAEALGTDRVTAIQWYYFPVLGYFPKTTHLHRRLATDPAFFDELVCLVYRAQREGEASELPPPPEENPHRQAMAENAWRLLHSWHVPPGTLDNGDFDVARCAAWIEQAQSLLDASDRRAIDEQHIGHVLTYTPQDEDGTWPAKGVRDLIEALDSTDVEQGFEVEMINRRGVSSRDPLDGGEQERAIAAEHRARAELFASRWPQTSSIFARLAEEFEAQARRFDAEADQLRRGFDR